jgi:hypothetical protein
MFMFPPVGSARVLVAASIVAAGFWFWGAALPMMTDDVEGDD